ncbi:FGGY-family carbohydrate kinase [Trueperella sp.]|uniref:FGGY-family carbohydrate kinase n=1 Tax=Trueperella sp. TaxID=2699835 RepID=UPI00263970F7|nr:FGGY-family carbohydrate kinase [Trueperella sp.]
MKTQVVIGIDGGTTAVKAVAFNLDGGIVTMAHRNVPVIYGSRGEAEQNMDEIWNAVADCLKDVTDALGTDHDILAVGLTGQGDGLWLVDDDGRPVRNAANWMDGRAAKRAQSWAADGKADAVLATTGTTVFPGLAPVLLAELSESDPEAIERAATIQYCKDWLRLNLTGERLTDYTEASRTFLDVQTAAGYSSELPVTLGLESATRLLPEIRTSDAPGGIVTADAADRTGLPEGTPVGIGMIDVSVTGVGLGAVNDGDGWLILGTTGFVGTLLASVADRKSKNSMVLATGRGTQVLEFLAPMTGTPNLDWIRTTFGYNQLSWDVIERIARTAKPGSNGIIYLPYGSPGGERAPFQDPAASASWMGMSISSTQHDILRSVYEGVTFSLVECIEALDLEGDLTVSGGGFRSDLVCEILADTTGRRVVRQDAPEAGARGAAVLALLSAGVESDLKTAARKLATGVDHFEPHAANTATYRKSFDAFKEVRTAIQPVWPTMRELREED